MHSQEKKESRPTGSKITSVQNSISPMKADINSLLADKLDGAVKGYVIALHSR
jgi:hypothetical protein